MPVQDSPGIRFSYDADVEVPAGLDGPDERREPHGDESAMAATPFRMAQPIPAYLLALAAGRSGVP